MTAREKAIEAAKEAERGYGAHEWDRVVAAMITAAAPHIESALLDRIREGIEKLRVEWLNLSPDYKPDFDDALNAALALLDEEAQG